MTKDEALRIALEALEALARYENPQTKIQIRKKDGGSIVTMYPHKVASEAITAIKAALEEKDEPVAWMHIHGNFKEPSYRQLDDWEIQNGWEQYPIYATPPQRKPLTDEEILQTAHKRHARINNNIGNDLLLISFARAIEAAHQIYEVKK